MQNSFESMSPAKLAEEIYHYRKLVKTQRKVLESLSQKVLSRERGGGPSGQSDPRVLNLKEQLEYYRAKSKVLEREAGPVPNLTKLVFEEIQRSRAHPNPLE